MSDTTSIMDLPTDPVGGGNNISLSATENISNNQQPNSASYSLDQTTINQIVSGLQQASLSGTTQLQSRDISMSTAQLSHDLQTQPNYVPIPSKNNEDYIKNSETTADMINNYNRGEKNYASLDEAYNEIQTPLLLAVLYFLFQLPFFRKFLHTYAPSLFSNDGNLNVSGFVFSSFLFGLTYYFCNKTTISFNAF